MVSEQHKNLTEYCKEEMMETMSIATLVGGTVLIPYLRRAVELWEELEENNQ